MTRNAAMKKNSWKKHILLWLFWLTGAIFGYVFAVI